MLFDIVKQSDAGDERRDRSPHAAFAPDAGSIVAAATYGQAIFRGISAAASLKLDLLAGMHQHRQDLPRH